MRSGKGRRRSFELRYICAFSGTCITRTVGQDLLVRDALVHHAEETDRQHVIDTTREGGLFPKHRDIQRVAIFSYRLWAETVVCRVDYRRIEVPIQLEDVPFLVVLVFVGAPARNLNYSCNDLGLASPMSIHK